MIDNLNSPLPPQTRIEYTFFPRQYIEDQYPKFLNPHNVAIKGLIHSVRYLPRTNIFFAKGVFAPVEMHPELPLISNIRGGQYTTTLPETLSHNRAGIFSTGSLDTGDVETTQVLDRHDVRNGTSDTDKVRTIQLIDALGNRLTAATISLIDMIIGDELDENKPTTKLTSRGPVGNILSSSSYHIISTYKKTSNKK